MENEKRNVDENISNKLDKPETTKNPKGGKKVIPETTDRHGVNTEGIPGQEDIDDKKNDADGEDDNKTRAFS